MNPCLTDSDLDRYHAGEADDAEEARVTAHLADCPDCARRDSVLVDANEELLARVQALGPMLPDEVVARSGSKGGGAARSGELPTDLVAGYRLIREIHRGGQGIVYEAAQESTKRKVALKLLLEGRFASATARRRFEREIELAASLKHANIVSIFHAGKTEDGRQFCVMDYVPGVPLHQYVRDNKLTLEKTLELFTKVCEAVNYAHQRGVIHRDLKPSNILVDAGGEPKVLDFGLAKQVLDQERTFISLTGEVVGTLPYMSPEQAGGNPDEIDVRTDVYALGVLLYEMLTGGYPYPVVGQVAEVLKHIAETTPTPPSRKWTSDSGVTKRSAKRLRVGECPIDDEVQTIVLRSLAKERERRYQSAGELGRDVGRYLADEPIEAKRDRGWYVLRKTVKRHRIVVGMSIIILIVLVAGIITTSLALSKAVSAQSAERQAKATTLQERDRSVMEAKAATEVAEFLVGLFKESDPTISRGEAVTAREVLDRGADRILHEFKTEPGLKARLLGVLGSSYMALGLYDRAEALMLQEADACRKLGDDDHEFGLVAKGRLGVLRSRQGNYTEGEALLRQVLDSRRRLLTAPHANLATSLNDLGIVLWEQGKYVEAEALLGECLDMRRVLLGERDPATLMTLTNMGALLEAQGRLDEAESRYRTALAQQRAALGNDHPETLLTLGNLGGLLVQKGAYSEAETVMRESFEIQTRVFGPEHPSTLVQAAWLGQLLQEMDRLEEAEQVVRSTMEAIRRIHGDEHPRTLSMMNNLAGLLVKQNKLAEAEDLYRELLPHLRTVLGSEHPHLATAMGNLAVVLMKRGDYSAAEPLLREQLELRRRVLAPGHTSTFRTMSDLGAVLTAQTRFVEAEPLLLACHEGLRAALGSKHPFTRATLDRVIELYESRNESEPDGGYKTKTAEWRAKRAASDQDD